MNDSQKEKSIFGAGLFGIAFGATVVALFHEPTRKKIKKSIISFLEDTDEKLDAFDSKASKKLKEVEDDAREKLASGLDKAKKKVKKK